MSEHLSVADMALVFDEIWRCKSAYSKTTATGQLVAARWDKSKKPSVDNLVILTKKEAERHYSKPGFGAWPPDFVEEVNQTLQSFSGQ